MSFQSTHDRPGRLKALTCRVEEAAIRDVGKALLLRRQRVDLVDLEAVGIVDSLAGTDRVILRANTQHVSAIAKDSYCD